MQAVGRYTVARRPDQTTVGPLLDDETGQRIRVPAPPDCNPYPSLLGASPGATSLGVYCNNALAGPSVDIYPVPDGPWTTMPVPTECADENVGMDSCDPAEVGRYWISYAANCYHCDGPLYEEQNLTTGAFAEVATWPGTSEISDLSSPTLTSPLCSSYAASINETEIADDGFVVSQQDGVRWALQRCGSSRRIKFNAVLGGPAVRPHLVLWINRTRIDGIYLPSQRQFVMTAPRGVDALASVTITPDHVYVTGLIPSPIFGSPRYNTWITNRPVPASATAHRHADSPSDAR